MEWVGFVTHVENEVGGGRKKRVKERKRWGGSEERKKGNREGGKRNKERKIEKGKENRGRKGLPGKKKWRMEGTNREWAGFVVAGSGAGEVRTRERDEMREWSRGESEEERGSVMVVMAAACSESGGSKELGRERG